MMNIEVDKQSGFCYGVVKTIQLAEEALQGENPVYCLGDIVHNESEVERLKSKGLIIINHEDLKKISNFTVLVRAHGEPPETYRLIEANANILKEGTCPIVLHLQNKIKNAWIKMKEMNGQVVIFGKKGHAEVIGLVGQTEGYAIVVSSIDDIGKIDFSRPLEMFAQTTQPLEGYEMIGNAVKKGMEQFFETDLLPLKMNDTICRHVSKRGEHIKEFALKHDVIIFVSGTNSSNGKILYDICKTVNAKSFCVKDASVVNPDWFANATSVGICSATSTPRWLMDLVAEKIKTVTNNH